MKNFILISVIFPLFSLAQDSAFNAKGVLKSIKVYEDNRSNFPFIRYFKESLNPLDYNLPSVDTSFCRARQNRKPWTWYAGVIRVFLDSFSYVYIDKMEYAGSYSNSVYNKIKGNYSFVFSELGIGIDINYDIDTGINSLYVGVIDTSGKFIEAFCSMHFQSAKFVSKGISSENQIHCGKYGLLTLVFNEKNLLNKIYLWDTSKVERYYELDDRFFCKKSGYLYQRFLRRGLWKGYHANGNLSEIGVYKVKGIGNDLSSEKDGIWRYFNSDGSLLLEEEYIDGKLVKH
jgi:antitoxin component YwqK of YwqJK toxin-antitoxin module